MSSSFTLATLSKDIESFVITALVDYKGPRKDHKAIDTAVMVATLKALAADALIHSMKPYRSVRGIRAKTKLKDIDPERLCEVYVRERHGYLLQVNTPVKKNGRVVDTVVQYQDSTGTRFDPSIVELVCI